MLKREPFRPLEFAVFVALVLLFITFGERVGWRAVGLVMLLQGVKTIRDPEPKVGFGWEGYEPSGHITGNAARLLGMMEIVIAIVLLLNPEGTVMRIGGSRAP